MRLLSKVALVAGLVAGSSIFQALAEPQSQSQILGDKFVDGFTLALGRRSYKQHCSSCHGTNGDGRGPAATGLDPAPRDLRKAMYKSLRVRDGELPTDAALYKVISKGIPGTAMRPRDDIKKADLMRIIQYIKTFSPQGEGWRVGVAILGGKAIPAKSLENGQRLYGSHCSSCHGEKGDGNGPAATGLEPAPRDLRQARYKFTRMNGDLPSDDMLYQIISVGLPGTAMRPRPDIEKSDLMDIIQYIKTFSPADEGWRDPENDVADPIEVSPDPWKGNAAAAIELGKQVYHGKAKCQSCHPSYATKAYISDSSKTYGVPPHFRDNMYSALPKPTDPSEVNSEYMVDGVAQWLKSLDFISDPMRTLGGSTDTKRDLYRIIGAGVGGTSMARWKGTLEEKELWAVAYYVDSLVAKRGTPAAKALRESLTKQTPAPDPIPPKQEEQWEEIVHEADMSCRFNVPKRGLKKISENEYSLSERGISITIKATHTSWAEDGGIPDLETLVGRSVAGLTQVDLDESDDSFSVSGRSSSGEQVFAKGFCNEFESMVGMASPDAGPRWLWTQSKVLTVRTTVTAGEASRKQAKRISDSFTCSY